MKKSLLVVAVAALTICQASSQYIDLGTLGTSNFAVDPGSIGTFTQTSTTLNFTAASLGDQVFGNYSNYTPSNWSSFSAFGIRMTITGTNPDLPFTVTFFDGESGSSAYSGFTSGLLSGVSGVAPLTLTSAGANLANVVGFQIGWDGSASPINVSMSNVAAVPEPSTYALLALGGLALGGYVVRRRQRA
jgi:PEP-CTERM motif